ncbi:uncharacterized protein EAF02_007545 [Botrytis sinoallii]|uniref:uncharacterized protein n=1 Tax=Botrytis sinoallii TaxID=1463999 RepID=UPI0018FF37FC|nr:uncharacterized protein EAF02_007545 [Botrytis sinoallii]KAF7879908.1 hypothetical protein EAF02_007545 [Botrytis sinoallii]
MNRNNYVTLQEPTSRTLLPSPFNRLQTSANFTSAPSQYLFRAGERNRKQFFEKEEGLDDWVHIMPELISDHDAKFKCHTSKLGSPFEFVEKSSVRLKRSRKQRRGTRFFQNTRPGRRLKSTEELKESKL